MIALHDFYGPTDWDWVIDRVPMKRVQDTCGIVATENEKIVGAVIFDNFLNSSVQATIIIENPMAVRRGLIDEAFKRVFVDCDKKLIYVLVAENNVKSLKLSDRLGFKEVMRIPDGYSDGIDFIVKELRREDCAHIQLEEVA